MRTPVPFATAVALAVALGLAGCSSGNLFEMEVGDCTNSTSLDADEVKSLPTVSCSQEHDVEAYAAKELPDGTYPGAETLKSTGSDFCLAEFEGFVGVAYADSELTYSFVYPTERSWNDADDRQVLCLLHSESPRTGSLQGSGR